METMAGCCSYEDFMSSVQVSFFRFLLITRPKIFTCLLFYFLWSLHFPQKYHFCWHYIFFILSAYCPSFTCIQQKILSVALQHHPPSTTETDSILLVSMFSNLQKPILFYFCLGNFCYIVQKIFSIRCMTVSRQFKCLICLRISSFTWIYLLHCDIPLFLEIT